LPQVVVRNRRPSRPWRRRLGRSAGSARTGHGWQRFEDPRSASRSSCRGAVERTLESLLDPAVCRKQSFLIDLGGRTFGVTITAFSPDFMKNALEGQILAAARKAAAAEIDGSIVEDVRVAIPSADGATTLAGRQVFVESESMRMVSRNRWVLNGGTLYRILQSGPTESTRQEDFERMAASFALTGAPSTP